MPLKKKKSKKKTAATDPNEDPATILGDTSPDGKKKKGKKKKITAAVKQKAKLEKGADTLLRSGAPFDQFLGRVERWLAKHADRCAQKFKNFDIDQEGIVSFDQFKSGLVDLGAPFNTVELYLMCKLLDRDETEEIEYRDLAEGLKAFRERELTYESADVRPALTLSARKHEKCKCCKMVTWDGECYREQIPRYVHIHFKLLTFDNFKTHPAHFKRTVPDSTTVLGLMELIRHETLLQSPGSLNQLFIFRDRSWETSAQLPAHLSLAECGLEGGPKSKPLSVDLFYDYRVEFKDCPLLMCDHYFGKKIRP